MQFCQRTLPTAAENLALDEALLEESEAGGPGEWLRLWEADQPAVVVGRSSAISQEVHLENCRRDTVPVLRRISGGAAIVAGPGCLMYALVLSYELRPALRSIDRAHRHVLDTLLAAIRSDCPGVARQGTSDLVLDEQKFSGNSVRCKRGHLLYHGTLLYDFPLASLSRYLLEPPHQPDYREKRAHESFVRNLPLSRQRINAALRQAWPAEATNDWPAARVAQLVAEKYSRADWNFRH